MINRVHKLSSSGFAFIGFGGYKDGSFRIIFRNRKTKQLKSVPLDKSDIVNYRSDMKNTEKHRLINKYLKKI